MHQQRNGAAWQVVWHVSSLERTWANQTCSVWARQGFGTTQDGKVLKIFERTHVEDIL